MRARGIVAAGHAATAAAAAEILADGGNAVDAAIAGIIAAAVAEPVLASLGGGGFLVARMAAGDQADRPVAYDFFTQTPIARRAAGDAEVRLVQADFGPARQPFHVGLGTIATPGAIRGLFAAAADLGRMPIRRLVEPACRLARDGVRVDALQAYIIGVVQAILASRPEAAAMFASPKAAPALIGEGDLFRLAAYADALEVLAIEGADLFYRGEMGRPLVEACRAGGGHVTADDLGRYQVGRRPPITVERFGARVHLNPPPALGGLLVAFGLLALPTTALTGADFGGPGHLTALVQVQALTEAMRRDLAARSGSVTLDDADAAALAAATLTPAGLAAAQRALAGQPQSGRGTTHISVIDAAGNAAALSLSNGEGSGYVLPGTGIILNNVLGEDDLNPGGADGWPCNRRLASMMAPALIERGDGGLVALGSGGSKRIRSAMLQVLVNHLAFGRTLAQAVDQPRLHLEGDTLSHEPGFDGGAIRVLPSLAATVAPWPAANLFFGGVHAAARDRQGGVDGAGDGRRGGTVTVV